MVWRALVNAAKTGDFKPQSILRQFTKAEGEYLARPQQKFYVLTSVSVEHQESFRAPVALDCSSSFLRYVPKRFDRSPLGSHIRVLFRDRQLPRLHDRQDKSPCPNTFGSWSERHCERWTSNGGDGIYS